MQTVKWYENGFKMTVLVDEQISENLPKSILVDDRTHWIEVKNANDEEQIKQAISKIEHLLMDGGYVFNEGRKGMIIYRRMIDGINTKNWKIAEEFRTAGLWAGSEAVGSEADVVALIVQRTAEDYMEIPLYTLFL